MQVNNKHIITRDEVVEVAKKMREAGEMLGLIHGHIDKEGRKIVTYDYYVGNAVESYEVQDVVSLPSISEIYDAAAGWPELEIHELMDVEFEGLDTSRRLFLPNDLLDGKGQILVTPLSELREKNIIE